MKIKLFSKAAHSTFIYFPEYKLLMDCGEGCATMLGINTVASIKDIVITHSHADHIAGLYNLIRLRAKHGENIPKLTIWIPESNKINQFIEFIGVHENVEWIYYGENNAVLGMSNKYLIVLPFRTNHCYNSYGFNLVEKRTRLRNEFQGLTPWQIGTLVNQGRKVKEDYSKTLLTYTGDTPPIEDVSVFNNPDILICDCTYLDPTDNNENYKHCTIDDAVGMFKESGAKKMIGMHLSARYNKEYIDKPEFKWRDIDISLADPDVINEFNV